MGPAEPDLDFVLLLNALFMLNTPYKWGGNDPMEGLDCSGFVIQLMKSEGIVARDYDSTAGGLYKLFTERRYPLAIQPRFGAIVFFGKSRDQITHVGFCIDDYRMIEAGGGNASVVDIKTAMSKDAFIKISPLFNRKDIVSIIMPQYHWLTPSGPEGAQGA